MIFFTIQGNQEDPHGNPIGYTRTTQRGKYADPAARRYSAWKDYVWTRLLKEYPKPPRFDGRKVVVSCYIEFGKGQHADPGNVVKGITDALADRHYRNEFRGALVEPRLFANDKNVLERAMDFNYSENPGVLVVVSEW